MHSRSIHLNLLLCGPGFGDLYEEGEMKASVVDLRYKMNDVLKALDRKEEVTILHRGKVKGKILPVSTNSKKRIRVHPFFGMAKTSSKPVLDELADLRNSRIHDL